MNTLENKTLLITGGLSGIGKARATAAAKEGANIVVADMKSVNTDKETKEIKKENTNSIFIECDVSVIAQVQTAIEKSSTYY